MDFDPRDSDSRDEHRFALRRSDEVAAIPASPSMTKAVAITVARENVTATSGPPRRDIVKDVSGNAASKLGEALDQQRACPRQ